MCPMKHTVLLKVGQPARGPDQCLGDGHHLIKPIVKESLPGLAGHVLGFYEKVFIC